METIFLKEPDLLISNRRIEVEKHLYPLYAVASIQRGRTKRRKLLASRKFSLIALAILAQIAALVFQVSDLFSPWPRLGVGLSDLRLMTLGLQLIAGLITGLTLRAALTRWYYIDIFAGNPADKRRIVETTDPQRAAHVAEALRNAVIHYRDPDISPPRANTGRTALPPVLDEPDEEDFDDKEPGDD